MPNKHQLVFLAAFAFTLSALILLSRAALAFLRAAGFPISHIILIGLPPPADDQTMSFDIQEFIQFLKANASVQLPGFGTVNLVTVVTSPTFIVSSAIILATAFYSTALRPARAKPLDPAAWKEFPLETKIRVSPNTAIYRFKLPHPEDVLGLPIGQHIAVSAEINGKVITRNYTPISDDDDRGRFDLIIKTYEKGNISRHVASLKSGDKLRVKGPKGNFAYTPNLVARLCMIAGGTGIAPMMQIIRAVLKNPSDRTTLSLIYANVNEDDILLKNDLEELADVHGNRFTIYYVLNNPPPGWKGGVGFVTKDHIKEHLANPAVTDSKLLVCGPPPMVGAMKKNLEELTYPVPNTISKLHDKVFVF